MADRVGRRNLLIAFFLGAGAACLGVATADSPLGFALWLFALGVFAAIYHPIGLSLLVSNATRLGAALGWNGVWGNVGAASASAATALIAAAFGWRAAFVAPGIVCILVGLAYLALTPAEGRAVAAVRAAASGAAARLTRPKTLLAIFAVAVVAGGLTFNIATIAAPKAIDERLGTSLPLGLVGSLATMVFALGAIMQLIVGRLIDRFSLPAIFASISVLQPLGLGLAATATGLPMLLGLALAMAAIYGQVVVNDAMVARYVPADWRSRAFGIRYFLGFTASGFAAPLIATLHGMDGFRAVFWCAALAGLAIFAAGLATLALTRERPVAAPAE